MNTVNLIIENGFNDEVVDVIVSELSLDGYTEAHKVIKKDFNECDDLELLKKFAMIMDDHHHIVDVEPRMCELMGEDEYFEMVEG